jgi:sugar O-acyltransferase (sialic acid O-acetyltransferase NeuD family)
MPTVDRWTTIGVARSRLVMWGASDQGRVNYPILAQLGCRVEAVIDDTPGKGSPFDNVPIYRGEQGLDAFLRQSTAADLGFVVAIGNPFGDVRLKLHAFMVQRGLSPVSFADPTALICRSAVLADGLQVMPGAIVHNDVSIGLQCIINTRSLVEHDCVLDDGVEIGPGAVLCGRVHVGANTWIGANATIRPRITIGPNSIIGAGSVVVTDIPGNSVAVGVPARVVRENLRHE